MCQHPLQARVLLPVPAVLFFLRQTVVFLPQCLQTWGAGMQPAQQILKSVEMLAHQPQQQQESWQQQQEQQRQLQKKRHQHEYQQYQQYRQ
mmetsp:Transcript_62508/g.158260  ORF Transcript_62508/g.158260 Transcript_62508/m.158260 type:complete len:91 (-) Transcript_62508:52-324(-)